MPPSDTFSDLSQSGKTQVNKLVESVKDSWVIVIVIVAMLVLVLVVIYIVNMMKNTKLQNVVLQKDLITLDNRSAVPYKIPSANMSLISNGQEYSYSFWIFLGSTYTSTNGPKIILQRGNTGTYSASTIKINTGTSPLIMLDNITNKMYFCVATSSANQSKLPSEIIKTDANGRFMPTGYLVTYIDYVPLQRWVNIALVVKNTSIYVYMDADLYSVASLSDMTRPTSSSTNSYVTNTNPIIMGTSGDLTIGDSVNATSGYVSMARFYNFAMGQPDIATMYDNGPAMSSWLSYLGLGNYGVRSPIYEVA